MDCIMALYIDWELDCFLSRNPIVKQLDDDSQIVGTTEQAEKGKSYA